MTLVFGLEGHEGCKVAANIIHGFDCNDEKNALFFFAGNRDNCCDKNLRVYIFFVVVEQASRYIVCSTLWRESIDGTKLQSQRIGNCHKDMKLFVSSTNCHSKLQHFPMIDGAVLEVT